MQETRDSHIDDVAHQYDELAKNGPYGTLAPGNRGGRKSLYVSAVFDAALLGELAKSGTHARVLDYGCGTGIFTCRAAGIAHEVIGVDISRGMLDQAKSVCQGLRNVHLQHTDGAHVNLPDGGMDIVVAREVLCYVHDAELRTMLEELRRVTRPGGRFLWLEQVSRTLYWQHHPKAPNLVKRSPEAIRAVAADAGWQIVSERIVRTPRFPCVYLAWFGLVPREFFLTLARWEVALHAGILRRQHTNRWWNELFELFELRNPVHG